MRVRDLGTLAITVGDEERPVAGTRATAMLALLTIHANQRVSVDALIDAAWGDRVTPGTASTLESHVWRLRGLLEPGRARGQAPTVLVNDAGGYRLVAGVRDVDSLLLAEVAVEVRDLLAAGRAALAVTRADEALALWRGRPYGRFGDQEWARPAVARLDELHGQVRERRIEALLATGAPDRALSDREPLVAEMPFRESLRGLQMVALHRSGRSEEALQTYQKTYRALMDEVGTEPGAELQELHRRILDNDPALLAGVRAGDGRAGAAPRPVEVHLPAALTSLIGRDDVRRRLGALVGDFRLVTVVGAAGCGKTRVAVEVARAAAPTFPDGVWFVDLTAVADPDLVVDVAVSTIGFAPSATATPLEDLRNYLRARRVLVVLDNCEHVLPAVARIVEAALGDADAGGEVELLVATTADLVGCPACGAVARAKDRRPTWVRDLPIGGRPVVLCWWKRAWCCPHPQCDVRTWTEQHEAIAPRAGLTQRARTWAFEQVGAADGAVSRVAATLGVAWWTVMRQVIDRGAPEIDDPNRLLEVAAVGVDETAYLRANATRSTTFATGIADLSPGRSARLLDVVEGRSGTVLADWLREQDPAWRAGIGTASLDPFRGYATALSDQLPDAVRVLDPFHVVRLGLAAVDDVRRRVQQTQTGHRGRTTDPLYGIRRVLRRRRDRLSTKARARLHAGLIAGDPDGEVTLAWTVAQDLMDLYRHDDPDLARAQATALIGDLRGCPIPELARLGRTLHAWRDELCAHFAHPDVSNGPTENLNLKIKNTKRIASGYRNFDHYRLRLLLNHGRIHNDHSPTRIRTRAPRFAA